MPELGRAIKLVAFAVGLVAAACALAADEQEGSATSSASLASDERLLVEIDLSIVGEPLPLLCEKLKEATGAKIWADPQVASEKVAVFCEKRPAWEVMTQVADLFGCTWGVEKSKEGEIKCRLFQHRKSAALDRGVEKDLLDKAWEACWKKVSSRADLWTTYKDDKQARAAAAKASDDVWSEKRGWKDLTKEEREALDALSSPSSGMFAAFIRSLPQEKIRMLRDGRQLVFSTYYTDPWWRLDPQFADDLARSPMNQFHEFPGEEAKPSGTLTGAVMSIRFGPAVGGPSGDEDEVTIGLCCVFGARYGDRVVHQGSTFSTASIFDYWKPPQPGKSLEERTALVGSHPWLNERITPKVPREAEPWRRSNWLWMPEMLQLVHEATGRPIVSDAYWSEGYSPVLKPHGNCLIDYLNELCYSESHDLSGSDPYEWIPRGDWLCFRCPLYPIARMEELPPGFVQAMRADAEKSKEPGLAQLARYANLSDWQRYAANIGGRPKGLIRPPWEMEESIYALRLCAAIPQSEFRDQKGTYTLPFPQMAPKQQEIFLDGLASPRVALWPQPEELACCAFEVLFEEEHVFANSVFDWPLGVRDDFEPFTWNGPETQKAVAAYQEFLSENPKAPKTRLHHRYSKWARLAYKMGDQTVDSTRVTLVSKEIDDTAIEDQAAPGVTGSRGAKLVPEEERDAADREGRSTR
jgi:hypothetical protein